MGAKQKVTVTVTRVKRPKKKKSKGGRKCPTCGRPF